MGDNALMLVERMTPELKKVIGDQIGAERFGRLVLTQMRTMPKLAECDTGSLLGSMMRAVEQGGEPGVDCWLIPFKGKATFVAGYQLVIKQLYNHPKVKAVHASAVGKHDEFEFQEGTEAFLRHRRRGPRVIDPMDAVCYYCVIDLHGGGCVFDVMFPEEIERIRMRAPGGQKDGPWRTDYIAMAIKTVVRRAAKMAPKSVTYMAQDQDEVVQMIGEPPAGLADAASPTRLPSPGADGVPEAVPALPQSLPQREAPRDVPPAEDSAPPPDPSAPLYTDDDNWFAQTATDDEFGGLG